MKIVRIKDTQYRVACDWSDLTIRQAATLCSIPMPESLRAVYDIALKPTDNEDEKSKKILEAEMDITPEDQFKNIPLYFSAVIAAISDIPVEVLEKTDINSIRTIYHNYGKLFVEGIHYFPAEYLPKQIKCFDFEGECYLLPVSKKVFGMEVPMVDMTAMEFTESSDLMVHMSKMSKDRDFSRISNMVAIICKKPGEEYNEEVSLERAERFMDLKMDVCWDVFFSLITPLIILNQYVQLSFLLGIAENKAKVQEK